MKRHAQPRKTSNGGNTKEEKKSLPAEELIMQVLTSYIGMRGQDCGLLTDI